MDVIHDVLEDGGELTFHLGTNVAPERLRKLLHSKEELELFRPKYPLEGPDVASGEIVKEVQE
jgi:hypothetical protein